MWNLILLDSDYVLRHGTDQCWASIHEVQQLKLDSYILFSLPWTKVRAVFPIGKLPFSWPQKHLILKK